MAKQFWLVTTQSKHTTPSGQDVSTFTAVGEDDPAEVFARAREQQPDRYWALLFAMKLTAAQAKRLSGS
jgi:hypothetical protein